MNKLTPTALCALLVACSLAVPLEQQVNYATKADYRLDGSIKPLHYEISLTPYILLNEPGGGERFTFKGKVIITFQSTIESNSEIVLHAKNLAFGTNDVELTTETSSEPLAIETVVPSDAETDKVKIKTKIPLEKDSKNYKLLISYTGKLADDMQGFYRSFYKKSDGQIQWLASTHFQTHHARKAFPCFDEPKYKATFKIEISHHKSLRAVSNTKIENELETSEDRKLTKFMVTPKMSTYLVAFLVSDFAARTTPEDPDFSVLARPGASTQTEYSYNIGKKLLKKMDEYFDLPYSTLGNKKMDLAAIPDFSAGAMENWGLITYRERALLFDSKSSTANYEQSVAATIAHEQVHMWFGDYVTCEWWGYTWLNEGFARYFQYYILSQINGDWNMEQQFIVDQIQTVFNMDSLPGSHKLSDNSVSSPSELRKMFSSISYNKGASVIRMIKYILGEEKFQTALRVYLTKYGGKTTKPQNLFDEFKKVWDNANVNLVQILEDFTTQVGYPVVNVKLSTDGRKLIVKQKRFLLKLDENEDASLLYTIPFTYATDKLVFSNTKPTVFLEKSSNEQTINLLEKTEFVIANVKQTGYYRVNYDEAIWHKIHDKLEKDHGAIDVMNRAQIVDDLFNLARADHINYQLALDILEYLRHETDYLPWVAAFTGYSNMAARLGADHVKLFGKHIRRITGTVFKKLGFEAENDKRLDVYNRVKVLQWACKYGNEECIKKSKELFNAFMTKNEPVVVNIRQPVYCSAIRVGRKEEFNFLWEKFLSENVATEQVLILNTLACTKDKEAVGEYLNHIVSDKIRLQDKSSTLTALYTENLENVDVVFDYVAKNYRAIAASFGDISDVASSLSGISSRFTNTEQIDKLKLFLKDKKEELGKSIETITKAIATAEENLKWADKIVPHFMDILKIKNISTIVQSSLVITMSFALLTIMWSH